jgi:hypothetical protein
VTDKDPVSYSELYRIADQILEIGEDRPDLLAGELERLPHNIRSELLASDLLNAYQVFYYYFREDPGDLEKDRLTLQPASALSTGVMMTGTDLFEVIFSVEDEEPLFSVSDGEQVIARFRGKDSYRKVLRFIDESS